MSDTPTTKETVTTSPPAPPKPAKTAGTTPRGVYVVYNGGDEPVAAYSAEVKAMRAAMEMKGTVRFRGYGEDF